VKFFFSLPFRVIFPLSCHPLLKALMLPLLKVLLMPKTLALLKCLILLLPKAINEIEREKLFGRKKQNAQNFGVVLAGCTKILVRVGGQSWLQIIASVFNV
jgi:hypothetical protein